LIPIGKLIDDYVQSIAKLFCTRLDNGENENELQAFHREMIDRFGPMPQSVEDLLPPCVVRLADLICVEEPNPALLFREQSRLALF
jgi:transcription-repair coupling factor (superfamily II helicase)